MFIYDPREMVKSEMFKAEVKGFKGGVVPPLYKLVDEREEEMVLQDVFRIKRVIFNNPATIVFWKDGTKTVVKCEGEEFDQEKGLAMAISKRALGNTGRYYDTFKEWCKFESEIGQTVRILWYANNQDLINKIGTIVSLGENDRGEKMYKVKVKAKDGEEVIINLHHSHVRKVANFLNVD